MSVLTLRSVAIGILATLTMDVLTAGAYKLRLIAPLSPDLIGRWFALVAQGQPFHSDIGHWSGVADQSRNGDRGARALYDWRHARACVSACYLGSRTARPQSNYGDCLRSVHEPPAMAAYVSGDGIRMVRRAWPERNPIVRQQPCDPLLLWSGPLACRVDPKLKSQEEVRKEGRKERLWVKRLF